MFDWSKVSPIRSLTHIPIGMQLSDGCTEPKSHESLQEPAGTYQAS